MKRKQFFSDIAQESATLAILPTLAVGIALGAAGYFQEIEHWLELEAIFVPTTYILSFLGISKYSLHVNRHLVK